MCKKLWLSVVVLALGLSISAGADQVGWWKFDEAEGTTARDSSSFGNDGMLTGGVQRIDEGQFGRAIQLDGSNGYVDLPIGGLLSEMTDTTLSIWGIWSGEGGAWQRLLDFGTGQTINMFLTPNSGAATGPMRFAMTITSFNDEDQTTAANSFPIDDEWHHVAVTIAKVAAGTEDGAAVHTLYLDGEEVSQNTNARYSPSDLAEEAGGVTTQHWIGRSEYGADPYFDGSVDDFRIYNEALSQEDIQTIIEGGLGVDIRLAGNPRPGNKAGDVLRDDIVLQWSPGIYAATHDVYFGTSRDDVENASRDNPLGVLVSQGQTGTTYALDRLDLGQTYYWRVDEVNAAPDNGMFIGSTWYFTVEPVSIALTAEQITATASTARAGSEPSKTIDGSGLDENDGHSNDPGEMWLSNSPDADPWIQYEFDQLYKLDRMQVWNSNQTAELAVGWGPKDVQVETSADGVNWTALADITQFTQAPGDPGIGPTDDFSLGGIPAKYVRILITNNWGGLLQQYSISEVRFYYLPVQAREPVPAPGTDDVRPDAVLSWRAGREAGSHEVFVGMDANAVLDGSAPSQTVTDNRFDLASLDLPIGESYFWKVNEVNDAEDPSVWEGPVWDFNIPEPLVVDDFESYGTDDIAKRPYVTWRDGLPYSNPAPGGTGNNTGAVVGHDIFTQGSPFFNGDLMEMSLIHGGTQSLPLYYDNSGNGGNEPYSEMTRTFSPAQDWSGNAIATLTLYFRGVEGNTGQLYVKINDTKLSYTDDPGAIGRPLWEQWNIDLASSGANLLNVQSLTVGIENAGSGLVYVDDIVLYRDAPAPAPQGTDPGNAGLVASYSMESNVNDDTGNYNGTATGTPGYEAGVSGQALVLDAVDDYVDLPIGSLIASLSDITVASWVNWSGEGDVWQRIFDFGSGTTDYMFLTPNSGPGTVRFAILATGADGESLVDGLTELSADYWHHVAVTIDSSTMTLTLYVDGSPVGTDSTALLPQDLGETTQNWLGQSQFDADPLYNGALDEFLIYDRALSEAEIRYLAGEQ